MTLASGDRPSDVAGAAARASIQSHPEQAFHVQAALLDRYAACDGPACLDVLDALGNLGTPAVLPSLEKALHDPDARTRAAAARSLRLVADPAADRLLASAMADDHDASVRSAAIFAVTFRPIAAFVDPLGHAARSDPADFVRSDAIGVLASHAGESPRIDRILSSAATDDPKDPIRRLARQALASNSASLASAANAHDPR
jgi:HEAT repeat protein